MELIRGLFVTETNTSLVGTKENFCPVVSIRNGSIVKLKEPESQSSVDIFFSLILIYRSSLGFDNITNNDPELLFLIEFENLYLLIRIDLVLSFDLEILE